MKKIRNNPIMTLQRIRSICLYFLSLIQILILIGLGYLEKLTYQKAGVNHHLRFKKDVFYASLFLTPLSMGIYCYYWGINLWNYLVDMEEGGKT